MTLAQPQLNALGVFLPPYPDIPSPNFNLATIGSDLVLGAQQGVTDALVDVGLLPPSYYATTYPGVNRVSTIAPVT
ncbi:MAG: hypothetical protein ACLQIK_02260 [Mycobacterium sp.]|uniref:hypothetical protein n=1 Tax=Mycobacterium sp. TaxID=1785 RepID=UPI003F9D18BF